MYVLSHCGVIANEDVDRLAVNALAPYQLQWYFEGVLLNGRCQTSSHSYDFLEVNFEGARLREKQVKFSASKDSYKTKRAWSLHNKKLTGNISSGNLSIVMGCDKG